MSHQTERPDSPVEWDADGRPRSRLYGDVYFSAEGGLAESRAVFLQGCGLPEAWAGRRRFVVGELGFGTGLNVAALIELWARTRPAGAQLHVFSVEAHPLGAADAGRALAAWPELGPAAEALVAAWPGRARGFHRLELPGFAAVLDLAVMDVRAALARWRGRADAWFLDGFSPAANPQMWSDEVLSLVGARSAPGARAATFTVAGQVRRGLVGAGFAVEKRPGFGRKRERLEARRPGPPPTERPAPRVAIVGAGVAGAAAARAVRAAGGEALLLEAERPGCGGSGNPAALVTPRLDAALGDLAELFAQALRRAGRLYSAIPGAILAHGVLQLAQTERDRARFAKIAACDLFEPGTMRLADEAAAAAALGETAPAALAQDEALVIEPAAVLAAWTEASRKARIARLDPADGAWRLLDREGVEIARCEVVILAAGQGSAALATGLPLRPVRGQASWAAAVAPPVAAAWGGYAAPTRDGVLFGATHDRDDEGTEVRAADHARNLAALRAALPRLAARLEGVPLQGRAGVRATTPDRLPLAGPAPDGRDGLFLMTGFGSRGFCLAPLLGEHVAALALGAPSPLPGPLAELVDPRRFQRRAARRGGSSSPLQAL